MVDEFDGKNAVESIDINVDTDSVENEFVSDDSEKENGSEESHNNKYLDRLQRLQAEFANYKKRTANEQLRSREYVLTEYISSILPILDDFDRMSDNHNPLTGEHAIEGVRLIRDKFVQILEQHGLKTIHSLGEHFDPNLHEAIASIETKNAKDGQIIGQWQKGYMLNDKLLRPAKVKVAKSTTNESDD